MRIIAGDFKGRALRGPEDRATRPTADRVREALFSHLEARLGNLEDLRVLDAFAGTGALGLEALSRGAKHCLFVESDRAALAILRANIAHCGVSEEQATVRAGNTFALSARLAQAGPFDLVLLDPPYTTPAEELLRLLEALRHEQAIRSRSYIAYEHQRRAQVDWPSCYDKSHEARYGKTFLSCAFVA